MEACAPLSLVSRKLITRATKQHIPEEFINTSRAYSQWAWKALVHNSRGSLSLSVSSKKKPAALQTPQWVCAK